MAQWPHVVVSSTACVAAASPPFAPSALGEQPNSDTAPVPIAAAPRPASAEPFMNVRRDT